MLALILAALTLTTTPTPADDHAPTPPKDATVLDSGSWTLRVAGEPESELETREGPEGPLYRAGTVLTDTKLPVGYPAPTPPGAIELKHYASVRRAEYTSDGTSTWQSIRGFWPLFQHIQRNDIAMTAPVEMETKDTNDDGDPDQSTMTFLYHTTDDGPTGTDGDITITDTEPQTWLAIGVQGRITRQSWFELEKQLSDWLSTQSDWQSTGTPRTLGYNGPNIPNRNQWWEFQIQVIPAD